MEGDAGTSRLNPPRMPMIRRLRRRQPRIHQESDDTADQTSTEVTTEDSPESEGGADQTSTEVTTEDSPESEAEADAGDTGGERGPSRLGRGWLAGIAAALILFAGAIGAGGYFALRFHHESQAIARNDAAALKAAIDCVSATQAPDTNAMVASEQKIIDCGTDEIGRASCRERV